MKKRRFFDNMDALGLALTYDDVRLKSGYAEVMPTEVSLKTKFSRNMHLNMPVVSAAMDTVTEHRLATALAKLGGLGVIHRNLPPDKQAKEVAKVKHHLNGMIETPKCVLEDQTIAEVLRMIDEKELGFHSFPVISREGKLVGVLTRNDFDFCDRHDKTAREVMTKEVMTGAANTSLDEAYSLMKQHKKKVLPLVNEHEHVSGLYVLSDVLRIKSGESDNYNLDAKGRLCVAAAIGTGDDAFERAERLLNAQVDVLVIDTAHGDSKPVFETLKELKKTYTNAEIVAGNISEPESAKRLCEAGADGIKVGQGPGCFAAGTRVLMANGSYKNIEEIVAGDRVIGGNGRPVTVVKAWCTGTREVVAIKHTQFYKKTYVTPDHRYLTGNLNSVSQKTIHSGGYKRILEQPTKTGASKIGWKAIGEYAQDVPLLPRHIQYDWPETFEVELLKRTSGNGLNGLEGYEVDSQLTPSYELGYILGFFLGDGSSHTATVHNGKSNIGSVRFYLSENEGHLVDKLVSFLSICFPNASLPKIKPPTEESRVNTILFFYKPLADYLSHFGKKDQKHLPSELLAHDSEYLRGLFEGLLDSDGHIESNGRIVFTNTSPQLIELFGVLCHQIHGSFPHNGPHMTSAGGLVNCNEENVLPSYRAKLAITHERRQTNEHQIVKLTDIQETEQIVPVYDIEVDSEEHSFIADNAIVHNSICTTRVIAGIGSPQVSAVYQCSQVADAYGVPICADGGLRYSGDLTIAIGAGAQTVMMGSMLAGTEESPGRRVFYNGRQWKYYRGMGSLSAMLDSRSSRERYRQEEGASDRLIPEGVEGLVPYKGSLTDVVIQYLGGLRAGMGYVGAATIEELREKADFHRITASGRAESHPHDVHITKESPNYSGTPGDSKQH